MVEGISNVSTTYPAYTTTASTTPAATQEQAEKSAASTAAATSTANQEAGTYEPATPKDTDSTVKTYSKEERSGIIAHLKADQQARIDSFKSLVEKIIVKQSNADSVANFDFNSFDKTNPLKNYLQGLIDGGNIDSETIKTAQQNISQDGEYGVEKTAGRILDFAKALIGDDMDNFEKIKDAVLKGFGAAEDAWGGELPSISKQTKDLIMSTFDKWEQDGNTNYTNYSELAQKAALGVSTK